MRRSLLVLLLAVPACGHDAPDTPADPVLLVEVEPLAPGQGCTSGGIRIVAGSDADGSGQLSADEIATTEIVCSTIYTGDLTLSRMAHDDLEIVIGDVDVITPLDAPSLRVVTGGLRIGTLDTPGEVAFPALVHVGASVLARESNATRLVLPRLESTQDLVVEDCAALTSIAAPSLEDPLSVFVEGVPSLTNLELPALRRLEVLWVKATGLTSLTLPQLTHAYDTLAVVESPGLAELRAPKLSVLGTLSLRDVPALTVLELPAQPRQLFIQRTGLASVGFDQISALGIVTVNENPALTRLSLGLARSIDWVDVRGNPLLAELGLPALTRVRDQFVVSQNTTLPACGVDAVVAHLSSPPSVVVTLGNDDAAICP
jgi:hypothetical protein